MYIKLANNKDIIFISVPLMQYILVLYMNIRMFILIEYE